MFHSFTKNQPGSSFKGLVMFAALFTFLLCMQCTKLPEEIDNDCFANISILQWNCRSKCYIDYLVHFLQSCKHRYDVVALQSLNCFKKDLPRLDGFFNPPVTESIKHQD